MRRWIAGRSSLLVDRRSGKFYWHSEVGDNDEELPDDIDEEKYISSRIYWMMLTIVNGTADCSAAC